jgi:alkylhydroperoxidase/carboxymuconolactone decarboxylase family protein YurZ
VREFIYIAVDGAIAHLYESGARRQIEQAIKLGATKEEILQVILLATSEAAHQTHTVTMPILIDELKLIGEDVADLDSGERRIKERFLSAIGTWPDGADALMKIAPNFIESFLSYRSIAWTAGPLDPKVREFIGLAVCASPAMLAEKGIREHIRRALQLHATKEEISEVLQLASAISIHTCTVCIPALSDTLKNNKST